MQPIQWLQWLGCGGPPDAVSGVAQTFSLLYRRLSSRQSEDGQPMCRVDSNAQRAGMPAIRQTGMSALRF